MSKLNIVDHIKGTCQERWQACSKKCSELIRENDVFNTYVLTMTSQLIEQKQIYNHKVTELENKIKYLEVKLSTPPTQVPKSRKLKKELDDKYERTKKLAIELGLMPARKRGKPLSYTKIKNLIKSKIDTTHDDKELEKVMNLIERYDLFGIDDPIFEAPLSRFASIKPCVIPLGPEEE